jgi:hypothetical protein
MGFLYQDPRGNPMTTKSVPKSKKSITLEKEIETKVRRIQARLIEKTDQTWSLSVVLNILVTAGLMQTKKMSRADWQKIKTLVEDKTVTFGDELISDFVKKMSE